MALSLVYMMLRRAWDLLDLQARRDATKDAELLVLRLAAENASRGHWRIRPGMDGRLVMSAPDILHKGVLSISIRQ